MADAPATGAGAPPAGKKKILGLPRNVAMGGILVLGIVGGLAYVWWKDRQNSSSSSTTPPTVTNAGISDSELNTILRDWQNHPGGSTGGGSGGGGGGGGKGGGGKEEKEGPEREWLENKTGSEHPWTYLRKHHERVVVGPNGSRTIVHDRRPPRRRRGGGRRRHR